MWFIRCSPPTSPVQLFHLGYVAPDRVGKAASDLFRRSSPRVHLLLSVKRSRMEAEK